MIKVVITGGACAGKTTAIEELASRGFNVVPEAAVYLIQKEDEEGTKNFPWTNLQEFEKRLIFTQKNWESEIKATTELVFLDRSLVDPIGYIKTRNEKLPDNLVEDIKKANYNFALFLDMLPREPYWFLTKSGKPRKWTYEEALKTLKILRQAYKDFQIPLIDIPVIIPVEKRVEFILEKLNEIIKKEKVFV